MGIYGYARDTTPNLSKMENVIRFTRAYTNCGNSRGSTFSILTGKSPITTKLTFPPDILRGKDALQHLPNILAKLGYFNVSINDGYYTSPSRSNLVDAFHMENGKRTGFSTGLNFWKKMRIAFSHEGYLLTEMYERHKNKIVYMIVRSSRLYNYARFVTWGEASESTDQERIDLLKAAIRETNQPLFAQVHLMTTHGPLFSPPYRAFSIPGNEPDSPEHAALLEHRRRRYYQKLGVLQKHNIDVKTHWDLYDDATLSVDHFFGETVQTLKETGKLSDTILIFLTDHGMGMFGPALETIKYPVPLIIHLPELKERRIISEPVQYLDIAPSILAYLNQEIPGWMEGNIVFGRPGADITIPDRPIFTVYAGDRKIITTVVGGFAPRFRAEKQDVGPPHFGIGLAGLIMDERYYVYTLDKNLGRLFDVSADPFNAHTLDNEELLLDYHEKLYEKLGSREIRIDPKPLTR
jgi:arylsulfatase A-like enzyme